MHNDTIVVTLYVLVGLAFGTIGLLTARTELVRLLTATAGYLLAAWHLWVLAFGGWHLYGGPRGAVLGIALIAVLVQGAAVVVTARREADPTRPLPARRAASRRLSHRAPPRRRPAHANDVVAVQPARHRVDTPSRTPTMYGQPYSSTAQWRQPTSPMVDADADGGTPIRSTVPDRSYLATWSDLAGDPDWADRWATGRPGHRSSGHRSSGHRWASHDSGISDWLDTLDR